MLFARHYTRPDMQLTDFRIQNYKKVDDSGWVASQRLMVLVGKNEAGKSTVFRGLHVVSSSCRGRSPMIA